MIPAKSIRPLRWLFPFLFVLVSISVSVASGPDVIKASRHDVSPPLSQAVIGAASGHGSDGQSPTARPTGAVITNPNSDPVAAPLAGPLTGVTSVLNFDGQSAQDNRDVFGFAFVPPDTNGVSVPRSSCRW